MLLTSKLPSISESKFIDSIDKYLGLTAFSMTSGSLLSLMIFLAKFGVSAKSSHVIGATVLSTISGNLSVLIGVFLLFVLVYWIKNSSSITPLNLFISSYCNTPRKLVVLIIALGVILSIDDYLAVITISLILVESAANIVFKKERTSFLVNLTAVACCCLSPFSSWTPVITSVLGSFGASESAACPL